MKAFKKIALVLALVSTMLATGISVCADYSRSISSTGDDVGSYGKYSYDLTLTYNSAYAGGYYMQDNGMVTCTVRLWGQSDVSSSQSYSNSIYQSGYDMGAYAGVYFADF